MDKKRLIKLFSGLSEEDRGTLLAFAEFLAGRQQTQARDEPSLEPVPMPRPEKESVVGAIRRLSQTYPMLDKATMLNETSSLMGEHVLHGVPAPEAIDKLEAVFERHYREISSA